MSILDKTLPASYKGVPFLVDSVSTEGGIKNAKHLFPNSNNQVIENLGTRQRSYQMEALISNNTEVDDYQGKRDALIAVFDSGEKGVLIHPLFGRIDNIIVTSWTLIENFTSLGVGRFNITLEVSLDQSVPEVQGNTLSQVINAQGNATFGISQDFGLDFFGAGGFFNNIQDGINQVNDLVDTFEEKAQLFTIAADKLDGFSNQLSELGANVVNLVRAPVELAQSIENLFDTAAGMYVSVEAAFEVMSEFFDFGDDDSEIQPTTASRVERIQNRQILREAVHSYSLAHAYSLASNTAFNTIGDQQAIADRLEVQYDKVVANKTLVSLVGPSGILIVLGISNGTKALLTEQRITVEKVFDENRITPGRTIETFISPESTETVSDIDSPFLASGNRVTPGRIINIFTPLTSARLLSYQYYGTSQLGEEITSLNGLSDASFIEGDLEIITS